MKKLLWGWMLPLVVLMGCSGNEDDLPEPDPGPGDETELPDRSQIPSFPGAEGGGMYTLGGAGGDVYVVSTLEDTFREGSLRHAVSQFGARTIVFARSEEHTSELQ